LQIVSYFLSLLKRTKKFDLVMIFIGRVYSYLYEMSKMWIDECC